MAGEKESGLTYYIEKKLGSNGLLKRRVVIVHQTPPQKPIPQQPQRHPLDLPNGRYFNPTNLDSIQQPNPDSSIDENPSK